MCRTPGSITARPKSATKFRLPVIFISTGHHVRSARSRRISRRWKLTSCGCLAKSRTKESHRMARTQPDGAGQVVLYKTPDGKTSLEVRLEGDTVWLTQAQMAQLF